MIVTSKQGPIWIGSTYITSDCMEKCANGLDTFVRNEGYYLEDEVEISKMTSRLAVKTNKKPSFFTRAEAAIVHVPLLSNDGD